MVLHRSRASFLLIVAVLGGCPGASQGTPDASVDALLSDTPAGDVPDARDGAAPDAPASDAVTRDTAVRDVNSPDVVPTDATMPDAAPDDAWTTDVPVLDGNAPTGCAPAPASATVLDVTASPYNAAGDGTTDDTAAIQRALDALGTGGGTVFVPAGTYMINALVSLRPRSNTTLRLDPGAILRAQPTSMPNYDIVRLQSVQNVSIIGGVIEGERDGHLPGSTGEWGMGVSLHDAHHVYLDGVTSRACYGDGFYVTGASTDVNLCGVFADRNRRQGMSITSVDGMRVRDSTFVNTTGTLPEDGVDIEPNVGETVHDVRFDRCIFSGNAGYGFEDGVPIASTNMAFATQVVVDGCEASGNGVNSMSTSPRAGFTCSNADGHVFSNNHSHDNLGDGFLFRNNANDLQVTGNTATHNGQAGIEQYLCMGNTITGNTVTDNTGHGIYSPSSTGGTQSGNTVSGNGLTP